MSHADLTFTPNPTQREMDTRMGAGWRAAWPFGPEIPVMCSEEEWRRFGAAAQGGPVLYSQTRDEGLRLHAGDRQWRLARPDTGGARRLEDAGQAAHHDSLQLLESWLSARMQRPPEVPAQRGFCPAVLLRTPDH